MGYYPTDFLGNASRNLQEGLTEMPCEMYVYPQGNDHILSPWNGKIIDSKVPAGMEYASSQESMHLVIPCDSRNFVMYVRNKTAHLNTPVYKTMRASMTFDLLLCWHRNRFQVSDPHAKYNVEEGNFFDHMWILLWIDHLGAHLMSD